MRPPTTATRHFSLARSHRARRMQHWLIAVDIGRRTRTRARTPPSDTRKFAPAARPSTIALVRRATTLRNFSLTARSKSGALLYNVHRYGGKKLLQLGRITRLVRGDFAEYREKVSVYWKRAILFQTILFWSLLFNYFTSCINFRLLVHKKLRFFYTQCS